MYILRLFCVSLFLILTSSGCKKSPSYQGKYNDAAQTTASYKVEIVSIELLKFLFSPSAYASNDPGDGPDIYFKFYINGSSNNPIYTYNQVYTNLEPFSLPYKFVFLQPVKLISFASVAIGNSKQTFDDLNVRTRYLSSNPIILYDYDGPATFSPLTIYNQALTNFSFENFIFKAGINKVLTEDGAAIIEYKITKL